MVSIEEVQWYRKPLRILQTVLREIDAVGYDADAVVRHMIDERYNVLVVNGGGIFDFFHSSLEFANPVAQMGARDILKEISNACAQAEIRVIARVDFRGVKEEYYRKHPDWFGRNDRGEPLVNPTQSLPLFAPCYNSFYRNEYAADFIHYLFEHYRIDGIWHNAVLSVQRCFCERCQKLYRQQHGHLIPSPSAADPALDEEYNQWKSERAKHNLHTLRDAVKSHGDDKVYVAEVFSMFDVKRPLETGLDLYDIREHFDFLVSVGFLTENRANPHYTNLTYPNSIVKLLKEIRPDKQPVVLFGGNGTSYRYVADPPSDLAAWAYQTVAAGGGYWNCYFNGMHPAATHDRRNAHFLAKTNEFLLDRADVLTETLPENDVVVFYSKQTKDRVGSDDPALDGFNQAIQGVERVLLENHVQYSFVTEETLSPQRLAGVGVVVLPNTICLSDEACKTLSTWVEAGGKLIATFQTSLMRPDGRMRNDYGLADLFGCSYAGEVVDTSYDAYQYVAAPDHPLLSGIRDTEVLRTGPLTAACKLTARSTSRVVCLGVPVIKNQPPEHAWRTPMQSEAPVIVESRVGQGVVVYFASQIDRAVMLDGHPDFQLLLANAVRHLLGNQPAVITDAPESLIVTRLRSKSLPGAWLLSLVNVTSSPLRPLRTLVPVKDVTLSVGVDGRRRYRHTVFGSDVQDVAVQEREDRVEIRVPIVRDFVSLRFDPID